MKRKNAAAALEPDDNNEQRQELIDAAAHLFASRGFESTSMRDIAAHVGKTPGSLYYHFDSKDDLLLAVHRQAHAWAENILEQSKIGTDDPWQRLESICIAHMQALLQRPDYAVVVSGTSDSAGLHGRVIGVRDQWEKVFRNAIRDLPLTSESDRKYVRLVLLGAMNHSQTWYRARKESPAALARKMVELLRYRLFD